MTSEKSIAIIEKIVAAIITLALFALSLFLVGMIAEFELLFEESGAELPTITGYIVKYKHYVPLLIVLPLIGLVALLISNKQQGWFFVAGGGLIVIAIYLISLWALYLPIVEMGKVVTE